MYTNQSDKYVLRDFQSFKNGFLLISTFELKQGEYNTHLFSSQKFVRNDDLDWPQAVLENELCTIVSCRVRDLFYFKMILILNVKLRVHRVKYSKND